jgi:hypothetical protein
MGLVVSVKCAVLLLHVIQGQDGKEADKLRTKSQIPNAAHIVDQARFAAVELVRREQRSTGSRMAAYDRVGSMIGASAGWLRKFIGRCPDVSPDLVVGFNLLQIYDRVCTRVEQAADNERSRAAALRAENHEAVTSAVELVARASRAPPAGTDSAE